MSDFPGDNYLDLSNILGSTLSVLESTSIKSTSIYEELHVPVLDSVGDATVSTRNEPEIITCQDGCHTR